MITDAREKKNLRAFRIARRDLVCSAGPRPEYKDLGHINLSEARDEKIGRGAPCRNSRIAMVNFVSTDAIQLWNPSLLTQACNTMDETLRKRLEALTAAGRAQSLDFEGVAARVATDWFAGLDAPDAEACARYTALMLRAASHLDAATAQKIAAQLAPNAAAPQAVLASLIAANPAAAAHILECAPRLPASLLLARAREGDAREAAAIARRADLAAPVVGALARRLESEVLQALAGNSAALLDRGALIAMTQRARLDVELGRLLLQRTEAAIDRTVLFLSADAATRRRLLLEATRASLARGTDLGVAFDSIRAGALAAADDGDLARFSSTIARALRVSRASIERLALDAGGEPLGLMFAAMGLAATEGERPMLALRRDLAPALADPVSGLRFALQAPPKAAAAIIAALIPGRPQNAIGEYAAARFETRGAQAVAPPEAGAARGKVSRS